MHARSTKMFLSRKALLGFFLVAGSAGLMSTAGLMAHGPAGANAAPVHVTNTPNCPAGTNWDAVLNRCR
jgi:hypothetical protein